MSDIDLTGTAWRTPDEMGLYPRDKVVEIGESVDCFVETAWHIKGVGIVGGQIIRSWRQLNPAPSDVQHGDLLTGTVLGGLLAFTDSPACVKYGGIQVGPADLSYWLSADIQSGSWNPHVTVTARKSGCKSVCPEGADPCRLALGHDGLHRNGGTSWPTPKPLMPWEEHLDWHFLDNLEGQVWLGSDLTGADGVDPGAVYTPVVPIPRELIEKLRVKHVGVVFEGGDVELLYAIRAVFDAADGAA